MYIVEAHIMIEQGLQNIGVFAHSEVHPEEVDLRIKKCMWEMLERDFPNVRGSKTNKPKLDKYSVLLEKEKEFTMVVSEGFGDTVETNLPDNYFHVIKADAVSISNCGGRHIDSGKLKKEEWYRVDGAEIIYNSISIPIRTIFKAKGDPNYQGNHNSRVISMTKKKVPTRFISEEFSSITNSNSLTKSKPNSPIAMIGNKKILVIVNDFLVEKVYISYLRKPINPNINFKRLAKEDKLVIGKEYEVVEGEVTHNSKTYNLTSPFTLPYFKAISTDFTGTGKVRLKGDGDIELNYQDCLKVINDVVLTFSIDSEQSQSKIQGLASVNSR